MLNSGDILDEKYEVIRFLGKGGMGVVYLCKNIRLGNFWAIKEVIKDTKNIDILTEANILKDLSHPGIRRIVDVFYEKNNLYMVQDYINGQTLKEYVKANGRMRTEKICRITTDLCDIVAYLHNQNPAIIYRDIKPSNIMITTSEKIILIDFGISKVYKSDTKQDTVCAGSNGYAAPEQYGLGKCCAQTDIYGIGMLIYFMVKGRTPFTGIEPLLDENYECYINNNLKKIIQKCVKIDIKDRYGSVESLRKELLEVLKNDSCEKTAVLNEHNDSKNMLTRESIKIKTKFKKTIRVFFCFIVIFLASIYILNVNKEETAVMNVVDGTDVVAPIVGSSSIEQNAIRRSIKGPIIVPIKVSARSIIQEKYMKQRKINETKKTKK